MKYDKLLRSSIDKLRKSVKTVKPEISTVPTINYKKMLSDEMNKRRALHGLKPVKTSQEATVKKTPASKTIKAYNPSYVEEPIKNIAMQTYIPAVRESIMAKAGEKMAKVLPWALGAPAAALGGYGLYEALRERPWYEKLTGSLQDIAGDLGNVDLSSVMPLAMGTMSPQEWAAFAGGVGQTPMMGEMGQPMVDMGQPNLPMETTRGTPVEELTPIQRRLDAYTPTDFHPYYL